MSPASNTSGAPLPSVAILGVDALLAARPATPVQLAHACQAAGYAAVYPVTWGDELIATACMRRVVARGDDPVIFCACPHVSDALLEVGTDLARFLIPLVAPPVACARYLRALYGYNRVRITYIGACPGAHDPAIDAMLTPVQFFGVLAQLNIALHEQPEMFESVLPPDRRRHRSMPGGAPTSDMLAIDGGTRTLEEIIDDDWKTELAQRLLSRHRAVFDIAPALGCHCSGARPGVAPEAARPSVVALEPPRSVGDVIDPNVAVDVDRILPLIAARTRDVAPAPVVTAAPDEALSTPPREVPEPPPVVPPAPPEASPPVEEETPRRKAAAPVVARAAQTVPLARTEGGQVLPRAYAARRRTPADGAAAVEPAMDESPDSGGEEPQAIEVSRETAPPESTAQSLATETSPAPDASAVSEPTQTPPERSLPVEAVLSPTPSAEPTPTSAPGPRPTPRSVTVPLPTEELRPVPPPAAADHARTAIVTGVATVALAIVAFTALGRDEAPITTESPGIAAPAHGILDSLPPLPFPLPDTTRSATLSADSTPREEVPGVTSATPRPRARTVPARPRRSAPVNRRMREDSAAVRAAARRAQDSIERDAIRRELAYRRTRLDSIARSLEPDPSRPDR